MHSHLEPEPRFLDYWRVIRIRLGLVIGVFLLVIIATGVCTYVAPREYKSSAIIEVQADMTPLHMIEDRMEPKAIDDSRFTATQIQIISTNGVLYPVIDRLNLQARWAQNQNTFFDAKKLEPLNQLKALLEKNLNVRIPFIFSAKDHAEMLPRTATYNKLRAMLDVEQIRNTNLIEINAFNQDPQEAALLANTIAQVYMEQRIADQEAIFTKSLERLAGEVKHKEDAVSQAFAEASALRTEANIIDPNPDSLDGTGKLAVEDSTVIADQERVNEARARVATLRSKVEQLEAIQWQDLMRGAAQLELNDPIIQTQLQTYQTALVEKQRLLNSGRGPKDPNLKALQAQIDTMQEQLRQQVNSVRKGVETQLAISENSLKGLEANLEASQKEQQAMKTASSQYLNAKYKYIEERKLLELAKTRLNAESMERRMPQSAAFIRDAAEVPLIPNKPKVAINMLMGAAAGLVLGISFAFFLEYLDTSVRTMNDLAKALLDPVLGVVPTGKKCWLTSKDGEDSPIAETYRILKANVDPFCSRNEASCFSVTSGDVSEGKSTTVYNLARAWADSGQRVLVIDADMHRCSQHRLFGLQSHLGLSHCLEGVASLDEAILPTSVDRLYLLTAGVATRAFHTQAMKHLIDTARERFDVILIDSPPIFAIGAALALCRLVDWSILVVQQGRLPCSLLLQVKKAIEHVGGHLSGVVLNKVDVRYDQSYFYSTGYKRYYAQQKLGL